MYWSKKGEQAWTYYLGPVDIFPPIESPPKPLLYIEMECAASQPGRLPEVDEDRLSTLVILVGESFEPLLQTIWAYLPQRLVPVVNEFYGDKDPHSRQHKKGQRENGKGDIPCRYQQGA